MKIPSIIGRLLDVVDDIWSRLGPSRDSWFRRFTTDSISIREDPPRKWLRTLPWWLVGYKRYDTCFIAANVSLENNTLYEAVNYFSSIENIVVYRYGRITQAEVVALCSLMSASRAMLIHIHTPYLINRVVYKGNDPFEFHERCIEKGMIEP